ncbi:hypothetical protein BACEGG_00277 [Bacteroides eggerthii DSM 20697]|nr:hypothetical protein BACEGG_00277 [Bacteroides eggerthii DSM 20697]
MRNDFFRPAERFYLSRGMISFIFAAPKEKMNDSLYCRKAFCGA